MSTIPQQDLSSVLETVKQWPPQTRVSLANMILQTVESPGRPPGRRGGVTAAALWLAGAPVAAEAPASPLAELSQAHRLRAYRDRWRSLLPA